MKKITKIEYQKNNKDRVNIYLDDSFEIGIDLNIMIKYGLCKNMILDDDFISEILFFENKAKAYNYAVSLLSRAAKSEKQVIQKMVEKGYDQELIEITVKKLKVNKFIDDSDYCERFIHDKINFSKYGKLKIKEALCSKGIDRRIIDEKLSVITDEDELGKAFELSQKKLKTLSNIDPLKRKVKLYNYLISKGFDYDTVNKAVSSVIKTYND
jgi:regulatory protein